jgi:hypothetical protein
MAFPKHLTILAGFELGSSVLESQSLYFQWQSRQNPQKHCNEFQISLHPGGIRTRNATTTAQRQITFT